jgi:predicted alpha/beta superfamily hydrolase
MSKTCTIRLTTVPDDPRPVFIAGTFNNWQAGSTNYQLDQIEPGVYQYIFAEDQLPEFPLEFKFMRGSWSDEETDSYGSKVHNHRQEAFQEVIAVDVPRWRSAGKAYQDQFLPKIQVIDEEFEIPQLIKTRRIAAILPHDYHTTDRRYPVLYLQDGQNLLDEAAPFGNWELDKKLAVMAEQGWTDLIVVAIDHGEKDRIKEFTPSYPTRLGPGDGKKYGRFLADTLKPFIDKNFRTLPDREHTGIGGSSMGGLISIYAGSIYPEVYGRQLIFSPSLWVAPEIYKNAIQTPFYEPTRIYVYAGGQESENMLTLIHQFCEGMKTMHPEFLELHLEIDPLGQHRELEWGRAFPEAAFWLFNHR